MHWWWNDGWSWWNWASMTVGMVVFWGLVAWVFMAVVRSPDRSQVDRHRSPEEILAERFASGDEYHKHLEVLRSTKVAAP